MCCQRSRDRQIIAFEQQGYGHTAAVADRPFSFEQSADDTAALLEYLRLSPADLFGFSNGGTIAVQVAIRHPRVGSYLESAARQFCLRQANSTRTGISFLTGMARSDGGSILNAANVAGIVPTIRVAPS
jgi:pimeloyl-ACP methyl ester carboxylesterase